MADETYAEILYIDGDDLARKTNLCCRMSRAGFDDLKRYDVGANGAAFIVDFHDENGDIADTIGIDADGFLSITGRRPKSEREYRQIDADFWRESSDG